MSNPTAIKLSKSDVAILVVSCDAYQDLWYPFFHCFFKFWVDCPYPIFLGSNFSSYPDSRVTPILVGPDIDYSTNLLKMLEGVEQEWVILWIEDRVLSGPVNAARIADLVRFAQGQRAGYLKLVADHPLSFAASPNQEIGEIPKGVEYRVCITVALWDKDVLLKLLQPGETAWDIEHRGSRRSNELDEKFLCLSAAARNDPPLRTTHLVIKGRLLRDAQGFLRQEGLLEYLKKRDRQTFWSYWYVKINLGSWKIYRQLRRQWWRLREGRQPV